MDSMNYKLGNGSADRAAFPVEYSALNLEERSYTALFPYNVPDFLNRVFMPGVFKDFLAKPDWQVQHLWTHNDFALPLGPVLELTETKAGLLFKAQFSDTVLGRDAWQLVQDGALSAISISWIPIQVERQEKNNIVFRLQQKAKLLDVSPVNFGGMPTAKILRDRMAAHFGNHHVAPDGITLDDCCGLDDSCDVAPLPYSVDNTRTQPYTPVTGDGTPRPLEGVALADAQEQACRKLRLLDLHIRSRG